jgi:hypothetical protein
MRQAKTSQAKPKQDTRQGKAIQNKPIQNKPSQNKTRHDITRHDTAKQGKNHRRKKPCTKTQKNERPTHRSMKSRYSRSSCVRDSSPTTAFMASTSFPLCFVFCVLCVLIFCFIWLSIRASKQARQEGRKGVNTTRKQHAKSEMQDPST